MVQRNENDMVSISLNRISRVEKLSPMLLSSSLHAYGLKPKQLCLILMGFLAMVLRRRLLAFS